MPNARLTLIAVVSIVAATPSVAQQLGERVPAVKSDTPANHLPAGRALKSQGKATACPEYGPGFVRLEGSNTCMRAGGKIIYEYGVTSGRSSALPSSGSRAAFSPEFETRTQTELGPFRMVVRGNVVRDTGGRVGAPFR